MKAPMPNTAYSDDDEKTKNIYVNTQSNGFKVDAFLQDETRGKMQYMNINFRDKSELKRAIILSEVLGKPKGL
jgi:hypothetical protein